MGIVPIFADVISFEPRGLFGICMNPDQKPVSNEYDAFVQWTFNRKNLRSFFLEREQLLVTNSYFPNSIREAVNRSFVEMSGLEQQLKSNYERGIDNLCNYLRSNFKPLDNQARFAEELQPSKTKGAGRQNWIRLYAVRVSPEMYIVTGGGIKLVLEMKDDLALAHERRKLLQVRDYLKKEGMYDSASFHDMILEL
jgi:hypothetical protein